MPSKAYGKFQKNLETVQRLNETYKTAKENRGSKGRGAFDHITRSAIVFLVSAFEVYCEDVLCESVEISIKHAKDACNLPHAVKKNINAVFITRRLLVEWCCFIIFFQVTLQYYFQESH